MVGCALCLRRIVRSGPQDAKFGPHHDPVKPRHRALGVKAGAGKDDPVIMQKFHKATAVPGPFVKITHKDGRHFFRPLQHGVKDRANLPLPPQAGEVKVHPDDPQILLANATFDKDRAAWLKRRNMEGLAIQHLDVGTDQHGISVPSHAFCPGLQGHRAQFAVIVQQFERQRGFARAKPAIGFLKGNDIGINFIDDRQDSLGPPQPVCADGLPDIVARDPYHPVRLAPLGAVAKPEGGKAVLVEFHPQSEEGAASGVAAVFKIAIVKADNVIAYRYIAVVFG